VDLRDDVSSLDQQGGDGIIIVSPKFIRTLHDGAPRIPGALFVCSNGGT